SSGRSYAAAGKATTAHQLKPARDFTTMPGSLLYRNSPPSSVFVLHLSINDHRVRAINRRESTVNSINILSNIFSIPDRIDSRRHCRTPCLISFFRSFFHIVLFVLFHDAAHYMALISPPSMRSADPVIHFAAGDTRKAISSAISSG